jgi:hypothetical protein
MKRTLAAEVPGFKALRYLPAPMKRLLWLLLLASCAPPARTITPAIASPSAATTPDSLLGDWMTADGARASWVALGDVRWGVFVRGASFEVVRLDRAGQRLRYTSWLRESEPVQLFAENAQASSLRFASESPTPSKVVVLVRTGNGLSIRDERPGEASEESWQRSTFASAQPLMDADRKFAADTLARGAAGWTAWFAEDGVMWQRRPYRGHDAILTRMTAVFDGNFKLDWHPEHAAFANTHTLGFTAGVWTAAQRGDDGDFAPAGSGSYLTVWQRQADGSYRVAFDVGSE